MNVDQILLTIITISAFCLGFRTITDDGMIFGFIRSPFLYVRETLKDLKEKIEKEKNILKLWESVGTVEEKCFDRTKNKKEIEWTIECLKDEKVLFQTLAYIMKPIIGCCACFASVWGLFVFYTLNGLSIDLWKEIIICCTSASFLNYFCWAYLEKRL
jgi:hypothetical protein